MMTRSRSVYCADSPNIIDLLCTVNYHGSVRCISDFVLCVLGSGLDMQHFMGELSWYMVLRLCFHEHPNVIFYHRSCMHGARRFRDVHLEDTMC